MSKHHASSQRGAALVTVLMIVAAMSAVAVGLTQVVTQATQRARALDGQAQIRYYAIAAEEVAQSRLGGLLADVQGKVVAGMPGLNEVQTIPVEGGYLRVRASDATNCFDLNGLVSRVGETTTPEADEIKSYVGLLEDAGFDRSDAQDLATAVVDWMDSDTAAGVGGAEDGYYASENPPYRTSGQPLSSIRELRAIRGYAPDVIARVEHLICARPLHTDAPNYTLNLNTLTLEQAPLLGLIFNGGMRIEDARRLIGARPVGGWPDLESFFLEPIVAQVSPDLYRIERMGLVTTSVAVYGEVAYRDQVMSIQYLFETLPGQQVRTLRRERLG